MSFAGMLFWKSKSIQGKNVQKVRHNRLLTTTYNIKTNELANDAKVKKQTANL